MYDNNDLEEQDRYMPPPAGQQSSGNRPLIWANSYDPGPNWNNGQAPQSGDPYQQYNNGSPVNAPLQAGYGWEWNGPQSPTWNMTSNNWDTGRWNQVQGRGLGYQPANTSGPTPPPDGPKPPGAVNPLPANGGMVPPASLPGDVSAQFSKVPEKTPIQSVFQDALLKVLGDTQKTPSLNDPILGPQAEIFRVQQQRAAEKDRRGLAERAAVGGQNQSGYLDRQINQNNQQRNFNTASFNANLLGTEMNKRRDQLMAALQIAQATGNAEAARELQTRLAQVQAMMQQQSLNLQGNLGFGDLALRAMLGDMGNNQFYDQLGVNTALGLEGLNQRALQIAMGGGNG